LRAFALPKLEYRCKGNGAPHIGDFNANRQENSMEITFWGTRGSIACPGPDTVIYGGNTTCLEITLSSGQTVIIDSGTGIRKLGDSLLQRNEPLNLYLLMTHIHWDHLTGFPFFGPLFQGDTHIIVDGSHRCMDGLRRVFSQNYVDGTWPVTFDDLKARIEHRQDLTAGRLEIDDTVVESHRLQHPQGGSGFRFTDDSGTFVFLTDNELREDGWNGSCFKDFVPFCEGADLLVHDCQYLPDEIEVRRGWGHSDVDSVARLALEAGVKKLLLFHHDPWRIDGEVESMVGRCMERFREANQIIEVDGAREGVTVRL
jgi:phosphoribosyl 1,2-cyclic phosphodiesterase